MKTKVLFLLAFVFLISVSSYGQRGVRIGYIDTEYILQNVPEYQEASNQLDAKVQKWKSEIESRLGVIEQKKKQLSNESVLLTKELIEERQEEISIEESEILDYQQKRFGPNGDLMIQKRNLMQPIQDQIFTAVQEIAANKKYDLVLDKSDGNMLYSADRFDISEQVLRSITRSSKRRQAQTKKERKAAENEELVPEINKEQEAREKASTDKKAERALTVKTKRNKQQTDREAKKKAVEDKKKKILEDRARATEKKLNARKATNENSKNKDVTNNTSNSLKEATKPSDSALPPKLSDKEARKKALEEKKKKIVADRKARLEADKKVKDSIAAAKKNN